MRADLIILLSLFPLPGLGTGRRRGKKRNPLLLTWVGFQTSPWLASTVVLVTTDSLLINPWSTRPNVGCLMVGICGCFDGSTRLLAAQFPDIGAGLCECGNCGNWEQWHRTLCSEMPPIPGSLMLCSCHLETLNNFTFDLCFVSGVQ